MMDRRDFIKQAAAIPIIGLVLSCERSSGNNKLLKTTAIDSTIAPAFEREGQNEAINAPEIFTKIMQKAKLEKWSEKPIGEVIGKIGMLLVDIPYVGGTLEHEGPERCTVNLAGLDCVTFFENSLDMARIIKKGKYSFDDLLNEVSFTRYRDGELTDYTSRLHYTADWIHNNVKKGVVNDLSKELGGIKFPYKVYFMTRKWKYYPALKRNKSFIKKIKKIEDEINSRDYFYIPKKKIKSIEKHVQTGDILALATNKKGLDYAHTGLAYVDEHKKVRFLHASVTNKKVMLDKEIHDYVDKIKPDIGISVMRPQEPGK